MALGGGFALFLAGVFLLAIGHKVVLVRSGESVPVLDSLSVGAGSRLTLRVRRVLIFISACIEAVAVVLLISEPTAGLVFSAALLLGYAALLSRVDPAAECGCVGSRGSARFALVRNLTLVAASIVIVGMDLAGHASPQLDLRAVAVALIAVAPLVGQSVLSHFGLALQFQLRSELSS